MKTLYDFKNFALNIIILYILADSVYDNIYRSVSITIIDNNLAMKENLYRENDFYPKIIILRTGWA
jgi:hypothetical protein